MLFRCAFCDSLLKVPETLRGKSGECPACTLHIELPDGPDLTAFDPDRPIVTDGLQSLVEVDEGSATGPEYRKCQMCGTSIRRRAVVCRNCGDRTPEAAARGGEIGVVGVWRDGRFLVMHKKAQLPDRCVRTNAPAETWVRRRFTWMHPAFYLLLLVVGAGTLALLALLIIPNSNREKADIRLGLTRECVRRNSRDMKIKWILDAAAILATWLILSRLLKDGFLVFLATSCCAFFILLIGELLGNWFCDFVRIRKITKHYVWLAGVHPDYLEALPHFPKTS